MKRWEAAFRLIGVGWYVALCILMGVAGGRWLDEKLNTKPPFLVIVGLILGIIIAFYGVYRMILPNINRKDNNKRES